MSSEPQERSKLLNFLSKSAGYKVDKGENSILLDGPKRNERTSLHINSSIQKENKSINKESLHIYQHSNDSTFKERINERIIPCIVLKVSDSSNPKKKKQNNPNPENPGSEFNDQSWSDAIEKFKLPDLNGSQLFINIDRIFKKILDDISHDKTYQFKRLLTKMENLCRCWRTTYKFESAREKDLSKLEVFCRKPFNYLIKNECFSLHELIIQSCDQYNLFDFLGIKNVEFETSELKKEYAAGVIIHQNFLCSKNIDLFREFYSSENRFVFGQMLLKKTFEKLNYVKLQKFMDDEIMFKEYGAQSVMEWFFWFHTGVCIIVIERQFQNFNIEEAQKAVDIAFKDIAGCLNKSKNRFQ